MPLVLTISVITAAVFIMGITYYSIQKDNRKNEEIKIIQDRVKQLILFDSISDYKLKSALDTILFLKTELQQQKEAQHIENIKMRRRHEQLEKLYRNLDISDRPDF